MPLILGGNQLDTGAYEVSNSLIFNDDDSASLTRTPSSDGNKKTFTWSGWVKRANITSTNQHLFAVGTSGSNFTIIRFNGTNLRYSHQASGSTDANLITSQVFRDPSAWYHFVVAVDNTQSTASDRVNMYVNGTLVTNFGTEDYPSNIDTHVNATNIHRIGDHVDSATQYFDGYLSEVNLIDGQQLLPTSFGEFNDNGVWIPKKYTGSYGTNGFFLEFKQTGTSQNSSGIGADTSGNDNHFAVSNLAAIDVVTDTCTNNFATINSESNYYASAILSQGNTICKTDGAAYTYSVSSIGVSAGKWYMEDKIGAGINNWFGVGIAEGESSNASGVLGRDTYFPAGNEYGQIGWFGYGTDFVYQNDGYYSGSTSDYDTDGYTTNDILGIALDADNNNVKFYKNGTVQNSGNAFTLGSSSTGFWHFAFGDYDGQNAHFHTHNLNFGQPSFSISSGNSEANGYGNFEYAVPSGYYALCTKNLAEFG